MAAQPVRVLLSGAGGFAGHHFLEHLLVNTDWQIVATDSFRHRGKTDRIGQVLAGHERTWLPRVDVLTHDLTAPFSAQAAGRIAGPSGLDFMIAVASESSVDRSITDPVLFVRNNVDVMLSQLELARQLKPRAVLVISTDEVYGSVPAGHPGLPEWSPILPSNPYSGSKAAQEALAIGYWRTYGVPVIIVNMMNLYGERQDPEKFIPMVISRVLAGRRVQIHGRPGEVGTRHFIHARNAADACLFLLQKHQPARYPDASRPSRYNVAGLEPVSNLELALEVASVLGRDLHYDLVDFHSARPGHDAHYALDMAKLSGLGWKASVGYHESLTRAVLWSVAHLEWLKA